MLFSLLYCFESAFCEEEQPKWHSLLTALGQVKHSWFLFWAIGTPCGGRIKSFLKVGWRAQVQFGKSLRGGLCCKSHHMSPAARKKKIPWEIHQPIMDTLFQLHWGFTSPCPRTAAEGKKYSHVLPHSTRSFFCGVSPSAQQGHGCIVWFGIICLDGRQVRFWRRKQRKAPVEAAITWTWLGLAWHAAGFIWAEVALGWGRRG